MNLLCRRAKLNFAGATGSFFVVALSPDIAAIPGFGEFVKKGDPGGLLRGDSSRLPLLLFYFGGALN